METEKPATPQQQVLVMWVLWGAFLVGGCVQYVFLHAKKPPVADGSQIWLLALVPVAISMFLRWNVLPRVQVMQTALVLMIVGISLAESAMFIGIFLFTAHQQELFIAAILAIAAHAPVYAKRLIAPPPAAMKRPSP